jgi:GYF domain 2
MPAKWYYSHDGQQTNGPCSGTELKKLAASGKLTPEDMVAKNRTVRLVKAGSVKGLFTTTETDKA